MSEERIQKILARAGVASRRKAEELIREGEVTVNGKVAELGEKADPEHDSIKIGGRRIQLPSRHHYFLLNKPKGVVSTVSDPEGRPTVIDLIPPPFRRALVPVGRLDFNTEGLLLLTDDGEFAQRLGHPRYGSIKVYEVKVSGTPSDADLQKLRLGILLDGKRTAPCKIVPLGGKTHLGSVQRRRITGTAAEEGQGNSWWKVELSEGRTRQIREMFFRIGNSVQKLRRVAIGPLEDRDLPVGAVRELSEAEVAKLLRGARETPRRPSPSAKTKSAGAEKAAKPETGARAPKAAGPARKAAAAPGSRAASGRPAAKRPAAKRSAAKRPAKGAGPRAPGSRPRSGGKSAPSGRRPSR